MPFRPKDSRFWHYDFQIRGRRFHGSCGTENFEEAKAIEAAARVRAKNAPEVTKEFTLGQALGTYYTDISQGQSSARTTQSQFKAILGVLDGHRQMSSLTNADLMRFVATRRAQVSNATVNRQMQALGRALRHMVKIHGATMPDIDLRAVETAEPEERVREMTRAEQERLFAILREDLHPLVKFALMTGARLGTIIGLCWSDIDLDTSRMVFRLKGGKSMRFPMNEEIRALLSTLPKADLEEHRKYVFTMQDQLRKDKQRRRIVAGGGIMTEIRLAFRAAEIHDFRFHDLRHTFATRMLRQTGNLKLVSRLLGHSDVETTTRYAHVLDDDLAHALDGFSALSGPVSRKKSRRKD